MFVKESRWNDKYAIKLRMYAEDIEYLHKRLAKEIKE